MIIKQLLTDSIPFSERETKLIVKLLEIYMRENPKIASFLYCIGAKKVEECDGVLDLSNLKFKWIYDVNKTGLMGAWNFLTPNTIYIACHSIEIVDNYDGRYDHLEDLARVLTKGPGDPKHCLILSSLLTAFPIVMHELYHMFQFKGCPVGYIFMRLVTVFTKLPFYISQMSFMEKLCPSGENTDWVQAWCRFTSWDLEGQAEKYGDKAIGMKEFCDHMNINAAWESYHNNLRRRDKQISEGEEPSYDLESLEYFKNPVINDHGSERFWKYADELHQWCKD